MPNAEAHPSMFWSPDTMPGKVKTIAIGGVADGQWLEGERGGFVHYARKPLPAGVYNGDRSPVETFSEHERSYYHLRTLEMRFPGGAHYKWSIFVPVSEPWDDFKIMDRLLQCYRPIVATSQ